MQLTKNQRNYLIIGVVAAVAVIAAILIIASSGGGGGGLGAADLSKIPQSRTEDGAFVLGSPDAPITIVEFADFTCPHCQEYSDTVDRFLREYVVTGKAKFEYRMIRSTGNAYGDFAEQLAECSETLKPNSFWIAHQRLFELAAAGLYNNIGPEIASAVGVNYSDLLGCTTNAKQGQTDSQVSRQAGVQGTPAIMIRYKNGPLQWISINGQELNRGGVPYNTLAQVVEAAQSF